jgi:DNA-binding protein HU-beta
VNKGEFAALLADRTELSKAAAGRAVDIILDTLTEAMAEHDEVSFVGWGKFSAQRRKGRDAHDPRNPQRTIHIAPSYVPKFKAGSVLKREIQEALAAEPQPGEGTSRQAATSRAKDPQPDEGAGTAQPIAGSDDGHDNLRETDRPPGRWRPLARR